VFDRKFLFEVSVIPEESGNISLKMAIMKKDRNY